MNVSKKIGVLPKEQLSTKKRLFQCLGQALEVAFVEADIGRLETIDALIVFETSGLRTLETLGSCTIPALVIDSESDRSIQARSIDFESVTELPAEFHGRTLHEQSVKNSGAIERLPGDVVLAKANSDAVWIVRYSNGVRRDWVSNSLCEIGETESLLECFRPGRFFALLPVIEFTRRITSDNGWTPPPARALFMVDDPNLHWPTYGCIDYRSLAAHAEKHNYHVCMATIPLDSWFAHPLAVRIFSQASRFLSLLIHGNNHTHHEMFTGNLNEGILLAAQALRRVHRMEQRTGLHVGRVVAAPHGRCSEPMCQAMLLLGIEALYHSRPNPWTPTPGIKRPIAGWRITEIAAGGLPIISRQSRADFEDEVILRTYLNHPVVFMLHEEDLRDEYSFLENAAGLVNSLGPVLWQSPEDIARSNFMSKVCGSTIHIQPWGRRLHISIPDAVSEIVIECHSDLLYDASQTASLNEQTVCLVPNGAQHFSGPILVQSNTTAIFKINHPDSILPDTISNVRTGAWPIVRRVLTEGRDRSRPWRDHRKVVQS